MLHSGIDLHKRDVVIATVDGDGGQVRETRLSTSRAAIARYFAALPGPHRAVVESTSNWYWLRDLCGVTGVDLRLGHSKCIKAISYAKVKTDAVDAATLAQLLRSDLIPEAHMVSAERREARDLLRARLRLTAQQTRAKNTITAVQCDGAGGPALAQLRVRFLTEQLTLMSGQVITLERELVPLLVPDADVQRLLWIPGVGKLAAFTLVLEIDGIERYPSARDFVLLPPGAGRGQLGREDPAQAQQGWEPLSEADVHAHGGARDPILPEIRAFYQRTARRKKPIVARALVAKELARIVFYVLHRQEPYNETFKGKPLSHTKQPKWPRLTNPPV